jgi:uracil-DNA glycosylase family 4
VGYSINPAEKRLPRPYTTNVLQCWPGASAKRDRAPTSNELSNCRNWWQTEIVLLRPKAILLLGKPAAQAFAAACLLPHDFNSMMETQGLIATFSNYKVPVFTVPHPTAPYKGPRGGRSEHYELAFSALKDCLLSQSPIDNQL